MCYDDDDDDEDDDDKAQGENDFAPATLRDHVAVARDHSTTIWQKHGRLDDIVTSLCS